MMTVDDNGIDKNENACDYIDVENNDNDDNDDDGGCN